MRGRSPRRIWRGSCPEDRRSLEGWPGRAAPPPGRQTVYLVPEIALTPQLLGRVRTRFGEGAAVLHSGLARAERASQWRRIRAGEGFLCIGGRSAVFSPFAPPGVLVVGEV